ncbi:hypothetical protein CBQ26_09545 [Deinococcus indicus]|uniref:Uncharacterized protein n=1 Tax=Deinococcus indicus TaxID=223556 RepID=A0A2D0A879_9DEIO|nr:hypothetical protein [Deinococcus indicus]OWL96605.1 hypothetical protein CBQ26_09545 [Deinococcus indicus]GHG33975.1 hypothetical protein GCM10017784_29680 [Deinococcus indicus]
MTPHRHTLNVLLLLLTVPTVLSLVGLGLLILAALTFIPHDLRLSAALGLWAGVSFAGYWHLNRAIGLTRRNGPLHGEVSEHLFRAGQRLFWSALLGTPLSLAAVWRMAPDLGLTDRSTGALLGVLLSPELLLGTLVSVALPLLLMALSGWLDEGRASLDRQRTTI